MVVAMVMSQRRGELRGVGGVQNYGRWLGL